MLVNIGVGTGEVRHFPLQSHTEKLSDIGNTRLYLLERHGKAVSQKRLKDVFVVELHLLLIAEERYLTRLRTRVRQLLRYESWDRWIFPEIQGYLSIVREYMHALGASNDKIHHSCNYLPGSILVLVEI